MRDWLAFYKRSFGGLTREVWLLSIVSLINRSGTMVLPFLTIFLTKELGFTVIQSGFVAGAFGLGSLAGSYLGGWATDRLGYFRVVFWSLFTSGLGFIGLIWIHSFWPMCIWIFMVSTLAESYRPGMIVGIGAHSKAENQTRAISLMRMAVNLGIAIGPAAGGFAAGTLGYDWLFILDGITCMGAAIFLRWAIRPSSNVRDANEPSQVVKSPSAYADKWYLWFMLVSALNITAFIQILSTVPLFFERVHSLTETQIGLFFTLNGLLIVLFEMPIVYSLERRWRPMTSIIIGAAMMIGAHLALNMPWIWWIGPLIYTLLVSFGEIINFPFITSLALERAPSDRRGEYMGLVSMMFSVTFIVGPVFGTFLIDRLHFTGLWYAIAALNVLAVVGFMRLLRSQYHANAGLIQESLKSDE